jgi:alkylation response protein AidB-like acyl-CoA dehydrogenase
VVWDQVVDLGWTSILVPEGAGGLGLGLVDMVVVLEEMGRLPFPGPFLSAGVLAPLAALRLGAPSLLGMGRGTVALEEYGSGDPVTRIRTRALRKGARWLLTGLKPVVLDGHTADWVVVAARTEEGLGSFLIERPAAELVPTWDVTRKVARLALEATPAERIGLAGDHTPMWRRVVDDGAVALCAELVGSTEQALELAVEYAKVRVQFGRPIATFQAIKHKCAEMLQALELARVGTHYAAWTSDVDDPARERAAAMAKGYVSEAANHVAAESIQIHGGVGFTWDCDAHLHYRRAKQNDLMLGQQGWQRRRLADLVLTAS